jgi:hypothetical protein
MAKKPKQPKTLTPEPKVKEIANEVDVIVVRLYCSTDGTQMELVGKPIMMNPPMFSYQCPKCKYKQISHNEYPMLVYKEKNNVG